MKFSEETSELRALVFFWWVSNIPLQLANLPIQSYHMDNLSLLGRVKVQSIQRII